MEGFDPSLVMLLFLVLAAITAGFMDTLVGGGGLITIPALMMAGVPPIFALGTNKLQSAMGSGTASLMMFKHRRIEFRHVKLAMFAAFCGSVVGSIAIQYFDSAALEVLIPTVIVSIAVYFLLAGKQSMRVGRARMGRGQYAATAVPLIGAYDGMFGPGTGSFFVFTGVILRGQEIVAATAMAKALNFATNFAALCVFVSFGKVLWLVGMLMMVGQAIGAYIGAHTLFTIHPAFLRYLVICVCFLMLAAWFFGK